MQYRKFQKNVRELFILFACSENCNNLTDTNKTLFSLYALKKKQAQYIYKKKEHM
jgi:hypothetical protein